MIEYKINLYLKFINLINISQRTLGNDIKKYERKKEGKNKRPIETIYQPEEVKNNLPRSIKREWTQKE